MAWNASELGGRLLGGEEPFEVVFRDGERLRGCRLVDADERLLVVRTPELEALVPWSAVRLVVLRSAAVPSVWDAALGTP